MKLIEFDNYELRVADEALLVRPIRELFEEDKSKKKENFFRQMSYMYFVIDPRSTYQYITDEEERAMEVKKQEGFGDDWQPSAKLNAAMAIYRKHCITSSSLLVEDMRYGLECIRTLLRRIGKEMTESGTDDDSVTSNLKIDKVLDAMTKAVDKIPELTKKLSEAEKALQKDFESESAVRGNKDKSMYEDV